MTGVLSDELKALSKRRPQAPALIVGDNIWSYKQLADQIRPLQALLQPAAGMRVGVWTQSVPLLLTSLAALDAFQVTAAVFADDYTLESIAVQRAHLGLAEVWTDRPNLAAAWARRVDDVPRGAARTADESDDSPGKLSGAAQVILFTSGTSGPPKPALHTWQSLAAGIRRDPRYLNRHWLLAYDPARFAGIQVWLQSLLTGGCLCVPNSREPADVAQTLVRHGVEFASATPTFWRMLLHTVPQAELAAAPLVQITLGGEAVDQPLLDQLHEAFPSARLTHIYASTEMGVCFAVSDGRAGFPATFLHPGALSCELRINADSELEIRSGRGMLGYANESAATGQWFGSGDVVERRDDRVHFVGRKSETINVGGLKVFPAAVEQCIRGVPGVEEVRVRGVPSSLTGQLVGAEVQAAVGVDRVSLRRAILESCRGHLAKHQLPACIEFVERLPRSQAGKLTRAAEATHGN